MHLQKTRFLEANIFIRQANYGGRKKVYLCGGFNTPMLASGLLIAEQTLQPHRISIHIPPISRTPKPAKPFRRLQVPILYTFW